jgi:hypothetical protein
VRVAMVSGIKAHMSWSAFVDKYSRTYDPSII